MPYNDTTYCASNTKNHTCGRELTEEDKKKAIERGLPIAMGKFCEDTKEEKKGCNKSISVTFHQPENSSEPSCTMQLRCGEETLHILPSIGKQEDFYRKIHLCSECKNV